MIKAEAEAKALSYPAEESEVKMRETISSEAQHFRNSKRQQFSKSAVQQLLSYFADQQSPRRTSLLTMDPPLIKHVPPDLLLHSIGAVGVLDFVGESLMCGSPWDP